MRNGHHDVTVQVPTAHGVLKASAPAGADVTADDVIRFQAGQLSAAHARIQELEIALGTVTNITCCALQVLADRGFSDNGSDEFSFSRDLSDRMRGGNLTLREDFAGGIVVKFAPRASGPILLEG